MKFKDRFYVQKISHRTAFEWVVKYHYLHRRPPCSFSFGLFDRMKRNRLGQSSLIGVIIYGTPSNWALRQGICGIKEKDNVIELTRLFIKDGTPQNVESFLITHTMRLVDKEIIVSYAEKDEGHLGIVYQACSWLYTGLSTKGKKWAIPGRDCHNQTLIDKYSADQLRAMGGIQIERPQKHRYVFFNCGKIQRRKLLKKLNYEILPYPKRSSSLQAFLQGEEKEL